jgi:hypothetical protein
LKLDSLQNFTLKKTNDEKIKGFCPISGLIPTCKRDECSHRIQRVPVPGNGSIVKNLACPPYFVSLAAIVALVVLVASWINGKLKTVWTMKQIVAWLVSMTLCFAGWFLGAGFLEGISVYMVLVYGLAAGLAANGIFDIILIQSFLKLIGLEKPLVLTDGWK